jgi:hypothetical protein
MAKCIAKTLKGERCKRNPQKGCKKCAVHRKKRSKKKRSKRKRRLKRKKRRNPTEGCKCSCHSRGRNPLYQPIHLPLKQPSFALRGPSAWQRAKEGVSKARGDIRRWYDQGGREKLRIFRRKGRDFARRAGQVGSELAIRAGRAGQRWFGPTEPTYSYRHYRRNPFRSRYRRRKYWRY